MYVQALLADCKGIDCSSKFLFARHLYALETLERYRLGLFKESELTTLHYFSNYLHFLKSSISEMTMLFRIG